MVLVAIFCHANTYLAIACLPHLKLAERSFCDTCDLHAVDAHQRVYIVNCYAPSLCIHCCIKHLFAEACVSFAGVSMGEARQVIQVPGAPPVSIRFGNRPPGSHPPPPGQQVSAPHGFCSLDQITCLSCGLRSQCHSIMCMFKCPDCIISSRSQEPCSNDLCVTTFVPK